ncbi:type III toxin-antitoxin system ToxN/AbiQ family toxin [Faecalispora sporosphaeroides]|uniref:type III toxin-antitoxin system ToxN/AbiQ family toxin n=1 Tax=Faecalispora sporosphaeroides TaxID=1549 RepID=UPI00035C96E2|nr:type III toxin-antitoxin system ToxN/AbiQ family toxin [Faecalispora sporosphaeroides]
MSKFKFYEVDKEYVKFLQKHEGKIPNISYDTNDKFVCGVLFDINGMKYFAPVSSFTKQQKTNILIKSASGKIISSVRLSFMFPIPDQLVRVKDFSKEEYRYKRLLMEELDFCNKNSHKIVKKALYIYQTVKDGSDALLKKNCCDFDRLESVYTQYLQQLNLVEEQPIESGTMAERFEKAQAKATQLHEANEAERKNDCPQR